MRIEKLLYLACLLSLFPLTGWAQPDTPSISSFTQQNRAQPMPLSIDEAFPFFVSEVGEGEYRISWNLAPGHYLYRHAFQFSLRQNPDGDSLPVDYALPDGLKKTDQFFGPIEAYYNRVSVELNFDTAPDADAELIIQYQGCADWGFCYPPQRALFKLTP